jgi:transposase
MIKIGEIVMIHDLKRRGLSTSAIARQVGLDRKTVRKHLGASLDVPCYGPRPARPTKLDGWKVYLADKAGQWPGLSARRLLREIQAQGYDGGYTRLTDYLRTIRPASVAPFEQRFETEAGEQAQVDFAEFAVSFASEPGVRRKVWLFSMVLGHSRWLWGRFCAGQDGHTVLRCHLEAFAALAGAPRVVLYDRMKTAVTGVDSDGQPLYNPALVALLAHYGALPRACQAYRAKTKGKVERPFRYIRQDFFLARMFADLADLNRQFTAWLGDVANARTHATTGRVVAEHFAEEQPHLLALPVMAYEAVLLVERRVTRDGMISVGGNLYSVPDGIGRKAVEVQHLADQIRVIVDGVLVASHGVLEGTGGCRLDPAHRVRPPRKADDAGNVIVLPAGTAMRRPLSIYEAVGRKLAHQAPRS